MDLQFKCLEFSNPGFNLNLQGQAFWNGSSTPRRVVATPAQNGRVLRLSPCALANSPTRSCRYGRNVRRPPVDALAAAAADLLALEGCFALEAGEWSLSLAGDGGAERKRNLSFPSLWLRPTTSSPMRRHRATEPVDPLFRGGREGEDAGDDPGFQRQ